MQLIGFYHNNRFTASCLSERLSLVSLATHQYGYSRGGLVAAPTETNVRHSTLLTFALQRIHRCFDRSSYGRFSPD
jgi:hypothetical protein